MPSVIVNMETGGAGVSFPPPSMDGADAKVRKTNYVPEKLKKRAKALEIKKQAFAKAHSPWKEQGLKIRAKGHAIANEIAEVKALIVGAQSETETTHRKAEQAKQEAATKRERAKRKG